ncbi:MAG: hypothetical protein GXP63_05885 [DPANN group archaeon]|nr:hypothetical protein [DPANN group archaeon]
MAIIENNIFKKLRNDLEAHDERRERVIRLSRDVIKLSKQVIYSLHRHDLRPAASYATDMKNVLAKMQGLVDKKLYCQGAFKVAVMEYVEAMCYLHYVKTGKLLDPASLGVDTEFYLMGISDLTGELIRFAVNAGSRGDFKEIVKTRDFVQEIYLNLMTFTFYGGELRKKFDAIKWDLKRLDEMVFELEMRDKLRSVKSRSTKTGPKKTGSKAKSRTKSRTKRT